MPRIPTYNRQQSVPGAGGNVPMNSSGIAAAKEMGNAVQGFTNEFADLVTKQADQIRKQDADNAILTIGAAYDEEHAQFTTEELSKAGLDTYDNLERVSQHRDNAIKKYTDGLDDPYVVGRVKDYIFDRSRGLQSTLAHHQANQRKIVSDNAIKSTQEVLAKNAYAGTDDLPTIIERFTKAVTTQVANKSRSADSAENIIMEGQSALAESYIDGVVNRNPQGAIELLKSGTLNQYLSAAKLDEYGKKANQLIEAEKRDFEAKVKEEERLAKEKEEEVREATDGEFVARFVSGKLTTTDILKSNLKPNRKEHWIDKLDKMRKENGRVAGGGVSDSKTRQANERDLWVRIKENQDSVTDDEIIDAVAEGRITRGAGNTLLNMKKKEVKADPHRSNAEKMVLEKLKDAHKKKLFGDDLENDREYTRQITSFQRWLDMHPEDDPFDYYERIMKVQERHIIGKLFGKKDPKARREKIDAEMSKPKAKAPITREQAIAELKRRGKM